MGFKEKFQRFMAGRYGSDQFSRFLLIITVVFLVVSLFWGNIFIQLIPVILIAYSYFRMFSKNHAARYRENQQYLQFVNRLKQRKTHHIYSCPSCKQKIRIPRGKGKIEITCPKCRTKFTKHS